jgi:hypothetical protein
MYSIIVEQALEEEWNFYYVQKDAYICRFDGKCFFNTLEILSANVDKYFNTKSTNKYSFESTRTKTLHTFETIEEFKELMCEYLI